MAVRISDANVRDGKLCAVDGPFKLGMIPTSDSPTDAPILRPQTYSDLTGDDKFNYEDDIDAMSWIPYLYTTRTSTNLLIHVNCTTICGHMQEIKVCWGNRRNAGNRGRNARNQGNAAGNNIVQTITGHIEIVQRNLQTTDNTRIAPNVQSYNCNKRGHYARDCSKPKVRDAKELNSIPVALVARFGVISKSTDRIRVSHGLSPTLGTIVPVIGPGRFVVVAAAAGITPKQSGSLEYCTWIASFAVTVYPNVDYENDSN
ncbi:reverse transcriptase [Tanacetum coccineum]